MQESKDEVKLLVASKAEGQLLRDIEAEVARRFTSLEGALLKGLQVVSDKAAGALELKLPITVRCMPGTIAPVYLFLVVYHEWGDDVVHVRQAQPSWFDPFITLSRLQNYNKLASHTSPAC